MLCLYKSFGSCEELEFRAEKTWYKEVVEQIGEQPLYYFL